MLNKPVHGIEIDTECGGGCDGDDGETAGNNQTESADDEGKNNLTDSTAASSGTGNSTSKKRNKGSEKLVLDLNDRSKYTKEVSV